MLEEGTMNVFVGLLAAALLGQASEPAGDLERLQGTWVLASMEREGEPAPPAADGNGKAPLPKVDDLKSPPDLKPDRGDILPPLPERSLGLDL